MKLADWIAHHGMSHYGFAKLIGKDESTISRWVNGSRIPKKESMRLIAGATGGKVRPADFYDRMKPE